MLRIVFYGIIIVILAVFVGSAAIDRFDALGEGPLKSVATELMTLFAEDAEWLVALLGATIIFFEYQSKKAQTDDLGIRKEQTARYWVYFNTKNKIQQDLKILIELEGRINREPNLSIEELSRITRTVLDGYIQTWNNDDVLSKAMEFEFVLLSKPEKERILRYFEAYNELEDTVVFARYLADLTCNGPMPSIGAADIRHEITAMMQKIQALIAQAFEMMVVMDYTDKSQDLKGPRNELEEMIGRSIDMSRFRTDDQSAFTYGVPWEPIPTQSPSRFERAVRERKIMSAQELQEIDRYWANRPQWRRRVFVS
ncbi:MAG: hypothetical protein AAFR16_07045 [Pseudomonadota bacterium]